MEEIIYKVNFDFESKLSGRNKKLKGISWFDHIFFFINENVSAHLNSQYIYQKDYINHLSSLNLASLKLSDNEDSAIDWWSNDDDDLRNKFFNSKVSMTKLGLEQNWIPIKTTLGLDSKSEYPEQIVVREEWGFSGKGTFLLNNSSESVSMKGNFVLSDYVSKIKDYGITFDLNNDVFFVVENYIDKQGQFKGGTLIDNFVFIDAIGEENYSKLLSIKSKLKQLGAQDTIQIDTFTYENAFHPFVEVNYRKTMGMMVKSLSRITMKKYVSWKIYKNKKSNLDYNLEGYNQNSFITSPIDIFVGICSFADTIELLNEEENRLEKFFSQI